MVEKKKYKEAPMSRRPDPNNFMDRPTQSIPIPDASKPETIPSRSTTGRTNRDKVTGRTNRDKVTGGTQLPTPLTPEQQGYKPRFATGSYTKDNQRFRLNDDGTFGKVTGPGVSPLMSALDPTKKAKIAANLGKTVIKKIQKTTAEFSQRIALVAKQKKAALESKSIGRFVSSAEKKGNSVVNNGLVKKGDVLDKYGRTVKTTKQADLINKFNLELAQKASPTNWKKIIGFMVGGLGVGALTSGVYFSEMASLNYMGDNIDRLGISASKLADSDIEAANELWDLQEEAETYSRSWASYIPFVQVPQSYFKFIEGQELIRDRTRESKSKEFDKQQQRADTDAELMTKIDSGMSADQIINDPDIKEHATDPNNWASSSTELYNNALKFIQQQKDYGEAEEAKAIRGQERWDTNTLAQNAKDRLKKNTEQFEEEARKEQGQKRLNTDREIIDRILNDGMTAEQIINDPEIKAFALDSNNWATATRDIWDQAAANTAREGFSGPESGMQTRTEDPSTLGFGLLSTGSQQIEEPIPGQPTAESQSLEDLAMSMFGIPYAQLTEEQKSQL